MHYFLNPVAVTALRMYFFWLSLISVLAALLGVRIAWTCPQKHFELKITDTKGSENLAKLQCFSDSKLSSLTMMQPGTERFQRRTKQDQTATYR